jgi:5-methylcytosine-specific restriction endonuclease McrA
MHVNLLRDDAWCNSCKRSKPAVTFATSKRGRSSQCRACKSAADKLRYATDAAFRDRAIARATARRAEKPEETRAATLRAYYKRAEYYKRENRAWRRSHKDVMRAHAAAWVAANPQRRRDVSRNYAHRRRALMRAAMVRLVTVDEVVARCEVFGGACAYCRRSFSSALPMTIDHVIPISRGGPHILSNLRPACAPCNSSKNARKLSEWKAPCYS